jgi:hypothetical protein
MNDSSRDIRLQYIRLIVKATEAGSKFRQNDADVDAAARVAYPRFARIATEDLNELYEYGQKCMASTIDEFLEVWNIKLEERQREAEIAARQQRAQQEQARLTSPHPNRDAVFAKWGFA